MANDKLTKEQLKDIKERARHYILRYLDVDSPRLYGRVNHISESGMCRRVSIFMAYISDTTGKAVVEDVTRYVGFLTGMRQHTSPDKTEIMVKGCGFNAVDHVVEYLSHVLDKPIKSDRL